MNANMCCRCEKRVYPIEELKCLDKVWHKSCFKCQECGMTLNLKTYKGYDKMPYCNAHVPQAKYTAVADTPEARRLKANTRIQSNIQYHQDFEKLKGKVTQVADDPETLRIRTTSKIISNVAYHGEYEKKKMMEEKRSNILPADCNGSTVEQARNNQGMKINPSNRNDVPSVNQMIASTNQITAVSHNRLPSSNSNPNQHQLQQQHQHQHQQLQQQQQQRPPSNSYVSPNYHRYPQDLAGERDNSPYSSKMQPTVIYTSGHGPVTDAHVRKVGSIADYDPMNDRYGSLAANYGNPRENQGAYYYGHSSPSAQGYRPSNRCFRAMYNYNAQDVDEASFREGDLIINAQKIDDGWMNGTVERTGQSGMIPANYVEQIN